jgi:LmbE family N-acetylglucosaminyl deacetylase
MSEFYVPRRAMFIFAHPDDIEFSVAGTAARWVGAGSEVTYVVITDGNAGSHEEGMTAARLAETRRAEQEAAAAVAGAARCLLLGYDDGLLEPSLALRKELVRLIRQYRPNAVVCGDPTVFFPNDTRINHPDHRAAATAAIDATFPAAKMPLLFPDMSQDGLRAHKVNYVYVSNPREATYYVDITTTMNLKIEALRQHASQLGDWDPEEPLKTWAETVGKKVGFKYAEGFRLLTLKVDEGDEEKGDEEEAAE